MFQKNQSLSPSTIKARLMKSSSKQFPLYSTAVDPTTGKTYTDTYDIFTVGAGYLDIAAAMASTDVAYGSTNSPGTSWIPASNEPGWQVNSIGIVRGRGRHYLLAVLTAEDSGLAYGTQTIEGIAALVWHGLSPRAR